MRKFWRDCRGAVTVLVTLLLIPAVLITGTGVDLARIYSARSILQDGNQLAANSVLASYDALLQDLYGLFAVMEGDELSFDTIGAPYVRTAVETDGRGTGMGHFQLFYGANLQPGVVEPVADKNLRESEVLRRQIEEFSKYRAPIIIVEQLMGKMEIFQKVQEDAKVIKAKMEVDDQVEVVDKYYRKIYNCIISFNQCEAVESVAMGSVTTVARDMKALFQDMFEIKEQYAIVKEELEKEKAELSSAESELAAADEDEDISAVQAKIEQLKKSIGELEKRLQELEEDYKADIKRLKSESHEWAKDCDEYADELQSFIDAPKESLEELLKLCQQAQEAKRELEQKLDRLDGMLGDDHQCSNELQAGLTERPKNADGSPVMLDNGEPMGSIMEQYRDLLQYDVLEMAKQVWNVDSEQIAEIRTVDFDADFPIEGPDHFGEVLKPVTEYKPAQPGFKPFQDHGAFHFTENDVFFEKLEALYGAGKGDEQGKENIKDTTKKIFKKAKEQFGNNLGFHPEGAKWLAGGMDDSDPSTGSQFGMNDDHDWNTDDGGKNELEGALDSDFLSLLADTGNAVGNKLLLLVYDTEMFSDYSSKGAEDAKKAGESSVVYETNMAGIPLSPDVNYYFQSELEYLYNGDLSNAESNLKSVAGMLFLIRFVFDYVASFSVSEVNTLVNTIKTTLSWTGPFAILAGELARLAVSLGESALDVSRLHDGEAVAIYKNNNTWRFSVTGMIKMIGESVSDDMVEQAFTARGSDSVGKGDENTATLTYTDYLRLFLLLVDGNDLAQRTANLIELNVTNKRYDDINANEESMARAERVKLENAFTGFEVTTTADLRMLFLSMPFAQRGVNGVVPPGTLPISVTDYRGY